MEIGAGYGNLTNAIASEQPKKIIAIEKDEKLSFILKNLQKTVGLKKFIIIIFSTNSI